MKKKKAFTTRASVHLSELSDGSFSGEGLQNLTSAEAEVLFFLTKEFLTPKQIAIRRQTGIRAIQKTIKNLKKKGIINSALQEVRKNQCTLLPFIKPLVENKSKSKNQIRLHGQEFNIRLIYKDFKYRKVLDRCNTINIDGNTIRLYRDSIEVYSSHSFYADDPQKATVRSFEYWNKFFVRLEHDLKVILTKPRVQNIKLVKQHYAEINNELAQECERKAERLNIYTTDDGKLWFTIDNSFNLHEAETLHPKTAKHDMEAVKPFFNDLRNNRPPTLSEIMVIIKETVKQNREVASLHKETASGLNSIVTYMKSSIPDSNGEDLKKGEYFG